MGPLEGDRRALRVVLVVVGHLRRRVDEVVPVTRQRLDLDHVLHDPRSGDLHGRPLERRGQLREGCLPIAVSPRPTKDPRSVPEAIQTLRTNALIWEFSPFYGSQLTKAVTMRTDPGHSRPLRTCGRRMAPSHRETMPCNAEEEHAIMPAVFASNTCGRHRDKRLNPALAFTVWATPHRPNHSPTDPIRLNRASIWHDSFTVDPVLNRSVTSGTWDPAALGWT